MFYVIPEMPSKTLVMLYKKLPDHLKVVMAWNLANYLPEEGNIRGNFNRVVMGYLSSIYDYLQSEKERIAPGMH